MLKVSDLYKSYGRESVLRGISLTAAPGQIIGVCGANGSGKTTLVNIIASIIPPDKGAIELMGVPLTRKKRYREMIGYVPQSIALSPRLTVRQNLEFWASVKGFRGQQLEIEVNKAADMANVQDFINKRLSRCSGGMARRANLAAGMVGNPQLLLLDEPTAGIDEENRDLILRSLEFLRAQGKIIIMVSHYQEELAPLCEKIITIKNGRIQEKAAYGD